MARYFLTHSLIIACIFGIISLIRGTQPIEIIRLMLFCDNISPVDVCCAPRHNTYYLYVFKCPIT
jgi:hypothetical protein